MARPTRLQAAEKLLETTKQQIKEEGAFESFLQGMYTKKLALQEKITEAKREGRNLSKEEVDAGEKLADGQR